MKKSKQSRSKYSPIFIVLPLLVVALLGTSFFWKTDQKMEPQLQSEYSKNETVNAFSPDGNDPFPGYSITFPVSWSYSSEVVTPGHPSTFPSQVTTLTKADEQIVIERAAFGGHDCQNFEDQLTLEPKLLNGLNLKIHKSVAELDSEIISILQSIQVH